LINILPVEVGNRAFFKRPFDSDDEKNRDDDLEPEALELDEDSEDLFELDREDI
jgi:hypothetical protein